MIKTNYLFIYLSIYPARFKVSCHTINRRIVLKVLLVLICNSFRYMESISKLAIISMCLTLFVFATPATAQWSQTFGWGGAGNGKRSFTETTKSTFDDLCSTLSSLQSLIKHLQQASVLWLFSNKLNFV